MKKLLSFLLVVCMLASMMALLPINAAEDEVSGTPIYNADDFMAMEAEGDYYLANDIDFDGVEVLGGTGYFATEGFAGTLDGNGFSLLNVTIDSAYDTGVFGPKFHGTLKNITIGSADNYASITCTTGGKAAGGVVSSIEEGDATFENVTIYANLVGGENKAGMFAGFAQSGRTITLTDCTTYGSISGGPVAGFIVTRQDNPPTMTFTNCVNNANVDVSVNNATPCGGFYAVSWDGATDEPHNLTFVNCVNNGNVTAKIGRNDRGCAAGFVGGNKNIFDATFTGCINNGTIYGDNGSAAGIVAMRFDGKQDAVNNFVLTDCVNNGEVKCESDVGSSAGLVAIPRGGSEIYTTTNVTISNSINAGTIIGQRGSAGGIFTLRTDTNGGSGILDLTITGCANVGSVSATDWRAGGIVGMFGMNADSSLFIANCYNAGTITNPGQTAAGIVGEIEQIATTANTDRVIQNCYNSGTLTGNNTPEIARNSTNVAFTVTNCAETRLSAEEVLGVVMTDIDTEYGTFVANSYGFIGNYPILSWQLPETLNAPAFSEGSIDFATDKYVISTSGISGYISSRNGSTPNTLDLRFVLAVDLEAYESLASISLKVEFCAATGVIKTLDIPAGKLHFYLNATAAGNTYVAAEGDALFGAVITDVPNGAWNYAILSVSTTADGAPAMASIVNSASVSG